VDDTNRTLLEQIFAQEDLNAAREKENAINRETEDLTVRLLEAQGKAQEALALKRERELLAVDESNRALLEQIFAQEDLNKARKKEIELDKIKSEQFQLLTSQGFASSLEYERYLRQASSAGIEGANQELAQLTGDSRPLRELNIKLVEEMAKLRQESQAGQIPTDKYLGEMDKTRRKWKGEGMPETRDVSA